PRFHSVKRLRKMDDEGFLITKDIDFSEEAVITDDPIFPPADITDARVQLKRYTPAEQRILVESTGKSFLASSEKLTPELRITIDGKSVRPIRINTMFAGANVPAGTHEVVFAR